jgi:RNA polymerase sigma-70 factor (ECF subfamily)
MEVVRYGFLTRDPPDAWASRTQGVRPAPDAWASRAALFAARPAPERQLIERVKTGDRGAFEALVEPYAKALCNFIASRTGSNANAQDTIQETMLSIWQSVASYAYQCSFKTWAFNIARRRLADFYRKNAGSEMAPITDYECLIGKDAISVSVERMDIERALTHLSDMENELVRLVFQAQLSYPEIAALLDIPVGTVKSRMFTIKNKLRALLSGEG